MLKQATVLTPSVNIYHQTQMNTFIIGRKLRNGSIDIVDGYHNEHGFHDTYNSLEEAQAVWDETMYLDWFNNFLSIPVFAEYYGICEMEADRTVAMGRKINHERATA